MLPPNDHGGVGRCARGGECEGAVMFTRPHVRRYECCSRQPESKAMLSGSIILTLTLAVHLRVEPDQAAVQQLCDVLRNDLAS
jgi:hypothetical protein